MFTHRNLCTVVLIAWFAWGAQPASAGTPLGGRRETKGRITTVLTFDPSQLTEGLAIDKEENIYVGFYYAGQIWKISPDGKQSIFATLDVGKSGGGLVGLAVDEDGDLYACDASGESATHGIWKIERNGATRMFAALDPTGFPNGIALDKAGNLFVTDSYLSEIWRISRSGDAEVWLQDPLFASLGSYGANGIEFDRGALFVSNTDQGAILRINMEDDDDSRRPQVFLQSPALVGADGIAFDERHNLYVAVDYQNMLVSVSPERQITTLATAGDGLDFPASPSFGQSCKQRRFLYWTNGGYNFGKPSLQKIDVGVPGRPLP